MKNTKEFLFIKSVLILFLIIASFMILFPLFIMVIDSFKTGSELARNSYGLPENFTLQNYLNLLFYNSGTIVRSYLNSVFISTTYTVLVLLVGSLAAYGFSKYKFKGKNLIFAFLLATMMVPTEITMPAIYLMFSKIKLLNSYWIQILPGIANVFAMFMIRNYMETIPNALLEAARIEGASHMRIFWNIMLPLAKPAIGAMAIMTFLGKWNDYLWPRMLLTKTQVMPIMVILPTLSVNDSVYTIPWEVMLAGCTVVTLPVLIVFLIFQDQFMAGVTAGAVKE